MACRSMQDDPPSKPNLSEGIPCIQPNHENIEKNFILSLPKTEGNPSLGWLILDGQTLALSHGHGESFNYRGIALAVQYFWDEGHRNLNVCVPVWKRHEDLPDHETHYLIQLKDHLQDLLIHMPSEAKDASYMEALARKMDALIVTQAGPDTCSEPGKRILPFTFRKDSFMLPDDPWGKNANTRELSVQVEDLMQKWEHLSKLLKDPPDLSLSEGPGSNDKVVIIDGSNVAMSHGLDTFYSCLGIYLAVQYFLRDGYRNITACVPNWRYNSRNSVCGYEYLHMLYKKGFLTLTPSEDDRSMLKEAKDENGLIVTNDKFRNFKHQWKDVKNNRIPFEFDGNHFIAFPNGAQAVGESTVRPISMGEGSAYLQNTGQTLHPVFPDPPRPEDED